MSVLKARIQACQARVVVVGAGYVGLPLAVETAAAGFPTVAFDKSAEKVRAINEGVSYI
ncbi:MAG: UDP-N-acetyl-D-glucosamine dehydrogenase, partial [Polyangia bacterium]